MQRRNPNNRSLLALAGESSVAGNSVTQSSVRQYLPQKQHHYYHSQPLQSSFISSGQKPFNIKETIKKLGFARLRKMQALVRGFLVRRQVYPVQLAKYLISQSLLDIITSNVIYRECSQLIVETVTLGRYDQEQAGQGRLIEEYLYNLIVRKVIERQFQPIAKDAIYQTAIYASRPTFTFGFNLRDPMEFLLFNKTHSIMNDIFEQIAEQAIKDEVQNRRELQVIDGLIGNMVVIRQICGEVIEESLLQGIEHYVVDTIFQKIVKEGSLLVSQKCYQDQVQNIEDAFVDDLCGQAQEWVLQQAILSAMMTSQERSRKQFKKWSNAEKQKEDKIE